jgi:two-component system sensor histidine kinase/response regulator
VGEAFGWRKLELAERHRFYTIKTFHEISESGKTENWSLLTQKMSHFPASSTGPVEVVSVEAKHKLLIVDDDPSVRHSLWITFHDLYDVRLAESGPKALDLFGRTPADAVVLDIRMPVMDGIQVLEELKQIDPDVEVLMLTGFESLETAREALRLGACDYLSKPFRVDILREAVSTAMGRRDASRKTAEYDQKLAQLQKEVHNQQMREELARTRNEIYGSIIHDLNGPLTVIAGYIDIIQNMIRHSYHLEADQLATLRNHSASISKQVSNCISVSRRYLGFLQGKAPGKESCGMKESLLDLADFLKVHPQARANELLIQPFEDDVSADINSTDLLQILLNLTINALQCTADLHKVEIYTRVVDEADTRQAFSPAPSTRLFKSQEFSTSKPFLAISVQDNGPGISSPMLDRIFEPYFTTKSAGQGSGLGLAIVKRLTFQAKGAIHVYSLVGEGTVFTVYLPIRES